MVSYARDEESRDSFRHPSYTPAASSIRLIFPVPLTYFLNPIPFSSSSLSTAPSTSFFPFLFHLASSSSSPPHLPPFLLSFSSPVLRSSSVSGFSDCYLILLLILSSSSNNITSPLRSQTRDERPAELKLSVLLGKGRLGGGSQVLLNISI